MWISWRSFHLTPKFGLVSGRTIPSAAPARCSPHWRGAIVSLVVRVTVDCTGGAGTMVVEPVSVVSSRTTSPFGARVRRTYRRCTGAVSTDSVVVVVTTGGGGGVIVVTSEVTVRVAGAAHPASWAMATNATPVKRPKRNATFLIFASQEGATSINRHYRLVVVSTVLRVVVVSPIGLTAVPVTVVVLRTTPVPSDSTVRSVVVCATGAGGGITGVGTMYGAAAWVVPGRLFVAGWPSGFQIELSALRHGGV
jgi:hypothetical protein